MIDPATIALTVILVPWIIGTLILVCYFEYKRGQTKQSVSSYYENDYNNRENFRTLLLWFWPVMAPIKLTMIWFPIFIKLITEPFRRLGAKK